MKGEVLFEKMTGISAEFIAEAALVAPVAVEPAKKKGFASLPASWRRGLTAACICVVAVIALLMGTATVGRIATPAPEGTPPLARFGFTYELGGFDGIAIPGDTVYVDTTIVNRGLPFLYHGSFAGFKPEARLVLQGNESVIIEGGYMLPADCGTHAVAMGEEGSGSAGFYIPKDAVPGVYDLVLSYRGTTQVYKGVLTVEESAEDPSARFEFGYTMQDAEGNVHDGFVRPGEFFSVLTTVTNKGKAFRCVEWEYFANACFVLHGDETVRITGDYAIPDSATPMIKTVENGESGLQRIMFTLPQSAVPGVYDLVLSYDGQEQVFENVLTVTSQTDTVLGHLLTFGYEPFGGFTTVNSYLHLESWVRNDGNPFTFTGSSMDFAPSAVLLHRDTGYRIDGMIAVTDDYVNVMVNTGDVGRGYQEFLIPADAPTGDYDLVLSYGGQEQVFENVLTVAAPVVEEPAVLYNLTMSIGSDWLYEPIDEAYVDGELVTVRIRFATDVGTLFFLNGEAITPTAGDDQMGYWEYSFYMPQKDSEIIFQTYDGTAPYGDILEAFILSNPYLFTGEEQFYYYGEFGDGVMVALQLGYGEAEWSTAVGGYTFVTPNTHDMMAFHNGTLYELRTAYDMGLLTDEHLEAMLATHMEWFPYD